MSIQHHLPSKVFYLDRLGNMSTSSSLTSSVSSAGSNANGGGARKQTLTLKPKQPTSYVQHLEIKSKDTNPGLVPVTMLELKKKERVEKNMVTTLTYRKPCSTVSSGSTSSISDHNHNMIVNPSSMASSEMLNRPKSPSSSGYDTDSLHEQENCDVFSNITGPTFPFPSHHMDHHHHYTMDMLHSHPIWSPQTSSLNNNVNYFVGL